MLLFPVSLQIAVLFLPQCIYIKYLNTAPCIQDNGFIFLILIISLSMSVKQLIYWIRFYAYNVLFPSIPVRNSLNECTYFILMEICYSVGLKKVSRIIWFNYYILLSGTYLFFNFTYTTEVYQMKKKLTTWF